MFFFRERNQIYLLAICLNSLRSWFQRNLICNFNLLIALIMKTKSLLIILSFIGASLFVVSSCSKEPDASHVNSRTLDLDAKYQYAAVSSELGHLGRVLFYDKSLSLNNGVSCGSCHLQSKAFSDNSQFSKGFEKLETSRNTPPIQNLTEIDQALFWDGRERLLQSMVMKPIFNHVEMGMSNPNELTKKVAEKIYYKELFLRAYGEEEVTFEKISEALSGFTSSIVSNGSRFDLSFNSMISSFQPISLLNKTEQEGMDLFFGKYNCGSCHNVFSTKGYDTPIPTRTIPKPGQSALSELVNIGLDANYLDNGRGTLTGESEDNGKFKIPNLRNVEITGPYMHDGRFSTLDEVIEHYNDGIKSHPNLDIRLQDENGNPKVMHISSDEKQKLITFLKSMTDGRLISDPKFSDPFIRN